MDTSKQAILLLAAGASRRMGQPKQLLTYADQPLILHLLALLCRQERTVYVVLGAAAAQIEPLLTDLPVQLVYNANWNRGMGLSLRCGVDAILKREREILQILCCVVDQVYLSQPILDGFWERAATYDLIAARYANGAIGVPALFGKAYFPDLRAVPDQQGARSLFRQYASRLHLLPFARGDFDLDYPEDWQHFLQQYQSKMASEEE